MASGTGVTGGLITKAEHTAFSAKVDRAGDTMTGDLSFGGTRKITNLVDPTAAQEGATKAYVDSVSSGKIGGTLTAGRVPFASGAATLSDDAGLVWDNATKRLGVGTTDNNAVVSVYSAVSTGLGQFRSGNNWLRISGHIADGSGSTIQTFRNGGDYQPLTFDTSALLIKTGTWGGGTFERLRVNQDGTIGVGTSSPQSILDISGTDTDGTLRVFDQTATTGVTRSIVRAGAGQATTNLMEWQDNTGAILARVDSSGRFVGDGSQLTGLSGSISGLTAGRIPFASNATTITDSSSLSFDQSGTPTLNLGNAGGGRVFFAGIQNSVTYESGEMQVRANIAGGLNFYTNGTNRMRIDNTTGNVGIGTITPSSKFHIVDSNTGTSSKTTSSLQLNVTPSSATSAKNRGGSYVVTGMGTTAIAHGDLEGLRVSTNFQPNLSGASAGDVVGINSYAYQERGSSDAVVGISVGSHIDLSSAVYDQKGIYVLLEQDGSSSVTNSYGLHIDQQLTSGGTSATHRYAVRIDADTLGTVTNDYAIYQSAPSQKSYFAGNVGIGTTSSSGSMAVFAPTSTSDLIVLRSTDDNTTREAFKIETSSASRIFSIDPTGRLEFSSGDGGVPAVFRDTFRLNMSYGSTTFAVHNGGIELLNGSSVLSFGNISSGDQVGLAKNADEILEINNGTLGAIRDLRVRALNPSGENVGIGTTSPSTRLDIQDGVLEIDGLSTATVSPTNGARIYYDTEDDKLKVSQNGGAYVDLVGAGGSGSAAGVAGSVQFSDGSSGFVADAANLFWDNTNDALGIGSNDPSGNFAKVYSYSSSAIHNAIYGNATLAYGVRGQTAGSLAGVYGLSTGSGAGVQGASNSGFSGFFRHNVSDGSNTAATLAVRQATAQTSDLFQATDPVGTVLVSVSAAGRLGVGATPGAAGLQVGTAGAASTSGVKLDGSWFSGGTSTTTKPHLLVEPSGATSAAWSANGTGLGVNSATGFLGNLLDLQLNGSPRFTVNYAGTIMNAGLVYLQGNTSTNFLEISNGTVTLQKNQVLASPISRVAISPSTVANSSGTMTMFDISIPDGTSSTGGFTGLRINRTGAGTGSGPKALMDLQSSGTSRMWVDVSGNIGIGTTSPNEALEVNGNVRLTLLNGGGTTTASIDNNGNIIRTPSDERLKTQIEPLERSLDRVLRIQGVSYFWKNQDRFGAEKDIGFIAQDLEKVVPEVVSRSPDSEQRRSVNYANMVALLVEALKELYSQVSSEFRVLKQENEDLKIRLELIESWACSQTPRPAICPAQADR